MLIRNPKAFLRGSILLITFVIVFCLFFMEIFPGHGGQDKVTGLVYADNLFNTLSKGSSNFFDSTATDENSVEFRIKGVKATEVDVLVPFKAEETSVMSIAEKLVSQAGLEVAASDNGLQIKGNLHTLLLSMTEDSLAMYNNNADAVAKKHDEADGKAVMKAWWQLGTNMVKPLQKMSQIDEASAVNVVVMKAIEPSYNFYGIAPMKVKDNIPLVVGFLIFYVVYTMWYGFAIFELFEGVGLSMKKTVKSEV